MVTGQLRAITFRFSWHCSVIRNIQHANSLFNFSKYIISLLPALLGVS